MRSRLPEKVALGILLLVISAFLYWLHFLIFRDAHHIFIYLLGDIAFLPVEVLLVGLVVESLLGEREKRNRLEKLNMVVGTFFSLVGRRMLEMLAKEDAAIEDVKPLFVVDASWSRKDFQRALLKLKNYSPQLVLSPEDLESLRSFLGENREFLVRLLENPVLLENEKFTQLLQAVFHLEEELHFRGDFATLPESDIKHLTGDVERAWGHLLREWLNYLFYLKEKFPYLFSLAIRTNPFKEKWSPLVE
ncbi:hypothetical protein [Atrimonas thermophila]|uniref:hypothetical protein n=1 Tax=Atrimonas thermophila TaxID=3064161 RepID=UPI00399C604F